MFLLVLAHPGCPGQSPEREREREPLKDHGSVVVVVVVVVVVIGLVVSTLLSILLQTTRFYGEWFKGYKRNSAIFYGPPCIYS